MLKALRIVSMLRLERIVHLGRVKYPLTHYFRNLEHMKAIQKIFGDRTLEVLSRTKVEFIPYGGYMGVDNSDGHLVISARYLRNGNRIDIYLDLIHELVHVRQFLEGKELFDSRYGYVDRPTEVEAYRYAVEEARNLGLSDRRICEYLKTEWISDRDLQRLAETLDVDCTPLLRR